MPEALAVLRQAVLSTLYLSEKELSSARFYKTISDVNVDRKDRYCNLRKQSLKMPTAISLQAGTLIRFQHHYTPKEH